MVLARRYAMPRRDAPIPNAIIRKKGEIRSVLLLLRGGRRVSKWYKYSLRNSSIGPTCVRIIADLGMLSTASCGGPETCSASATDGSSPSPRAVQAETLWRNLTLKIDRWRSSRRIVVPSEDLRRLLHHLQRGQPVRKTST